MYSDKIEDELIFENYITKKRGIINESKQNKVYICAINGDRGLTIGKIVQVQQRVIDDINNVVEDAIYNGLSNLNTDIEDVDVFDGDIEDIMGQLQEGIFDTDISFLVDDEINVLITRNLKGAHSLLKDFHLDDTIINKIMSKVIDDGVADFAAYSNNNHFDDYDITFYNTSSSPRSWANISASKEISKIVKGQRAVNRSNFD